MDPSFYLRVVWQVQQLVGGHVPESRALELGSVAGVDEALVGGVQVGVAQRTQHAPQVPAQSVVQLLPSSCLGGPATASDCGV